MSVKVEIKVEAEPMAEFMLYHIYMSKAGLFALALGLMNVGLTLAFFFKKEYLLAGLFIFFVLLIFSVFPFFIRKKVTEKMRKSKQLGEIVTYEFMDDGIVTTTANDSGKASWSRFKRAIGRKQIIILYDKNKQAIVLPVDQLGEQHDDVVEMIFANMPAPAVRMRRPNKK